MPTAQSANNESYESFIQGIRLVTIGLKSCSASLDRQKWYELAASEKKELRIFNDEYHASEIGDGYFEIVGEFSVRVAESLEANAPLTVKCEFEAHFHGGSLKKSLVDRFAASDFRFVIIPFVRQFVSSITSQMAIPPLTIPLSTKVRREAPSRSKSEPRKLKGKA